MAFWVTCKIAQPILPIWQLIFALSYSALKEPQWEFNFFHIFGIPSSSRHENLKHETFLVFQYSRNSQWRIRKFVVVLNGQLDSFEPFAYSRHEQYKME